MSKGSGQIRAKMCATLSGLAIHMIQLAWLDHAFAV